MSARQTRPSAAPDPSTRLPTSVGFLVGVGSFVTEFVVAFAIGMAELTLLVPLAFLVFGIYALIGMGYAPTRPFQRGFTPGLAVGVLVWLTLFDTNTLDVVIYLVTSVIGWAAGLELSRRRGRLPAELPTLGPRRQPGPTRRQ